MYSAPLPGALCLFLAALLPSCGGGNGNGGTQPETRTLASTSGNAQSGTVGEPLADPLVVTVTEGGAPVAGVTVAFSTSTGAGSVEPTSAVTDANGRASTGWTLGTAAGSQSAQAAVTGASGSPVTFTATAEAGAAASIAATGGNNQTGEINTQLPAPLQAKVSDQFGNGVAGVAVAWAATGGTVSSPSVPTDQAGVSAINLTLGATAGPVTATATADGLSGSPVSFTATAVEPAPVPTEIDVTVGNIFFRSNRNDTEPAVDTVAVGGTVIWTWVNTGLEPHSVRSTGSPSFTSSATLTGNGQTFSRTFSAAGTYTYDCAVHGSQMTGRVVVR